MVKIIDYKAGNAPSVLSAAERLGYKADLANNPEELKNASHIILPGVGSAKATMDSLHDLGLINALEYAVFQEKSLFLGICVGMQILFQYSEEEGTNCLGWFDGTVEKFDDKCVKVPQMGWNKVVFIQQTPFADKCPDSYYYFVNSYFVKPRDKGIVWGKADYNGYFAAAIHKDNVFATQFHLEKSGEAGLALLQGFLSHNPDRTGKGGL